MIISIGDSNAPVYGPSLDLASAAAQAHQKALNAAAAKKKKAAAAAKPASSSSSTALVPTATPAHQTQWPYVLGGLAVLIGAWWYYYRRPKHHGNPRRGGRRRSGRPFVARGAHGRFE